MASGKPSILRTPPPPVTRQTGHRIGMNMKARMTIIAIGLTVAGTAFANAEEAGTASADQTFAAMDTDKNGSIDRTEFDAYAKSYADRQRQDFERQFAELDADKDGKIDKEESGANAALEAYFDQIDQDGDSFLTKEEIGSAMRAAHEASASR